jgi:hypothetical protein
VGARANLGDASLRVLLPLRVALHLLLVMFLTRSEYGEESVYSTYERECLCVIQTVV